MLELEFGSEAGTGLGAWLGLGVGPGPGSVAGPAVVTVLEIGAAFGLVTE